MRSNLRHNLRNTGLGWCWNTDNRVQSGVRVLRDVVLGSLEKLWNCGKKRTVDKIVDNEENVRVLPTLVLNFTLQSGSFIKILEICKGSWQH